MVTEAWVSVINKNFFRDAPWLNMMTNYDIYINNNKLHIPYQGAEPVVYVNNNVYPLAVVRLPDGEVVITMDKYETQPSFLVDPEVSELSYNAMESDMGKHRTALVRRTIERAAYMVAPAGNTAPAPILDATGADDGNGRKRLTLQDLSRGDLLLTNMEIPSGDRCLVLSTQHCDDIRLEDEGRFNQLMDHKADPTKGPVPIYGWNVWVDQDHVHYNMTSAAKLPQGAIPTAGESAASFFWHKSCMGRGKTPIKLKFDPNAVQFSGVMANANMRYQTFPTRKDAIGTGCFRSGAA